MRWVGHVAGMGEVRNVYNILVGKPEGERPLRRPMNSWEEWILGKQGGKVWTGCIWLRIGTGGRIL